MHVVIRGHHLPGGESFVALQDRDEAVGRVAATATSAEWQLEVRTVVDAHGELDFRGSAVHGKRGDRFLYLTWGDVGPDGSFSMFRRAKLMLNRVDDDVMRRAVDGAANGVALMAQVDLTDERGGPRCARVDPPAIEWSAS
ncbi:hypothetical protein BH10ACT3_BH10ACT3_00950 [soil metagenome]